MARWTRACTRTPAAHPLASAGWCQVTRLSRVRQRHRVAGLLRRDRHRGRVLGWRPAAAGAVLGEVGRGHGRGGDDLGGMPLGSSRLSRTSSGLARPVGVSWLAASTDRAQGDRTGTAGTRRASRWGASSPAVSSVGEPGPVVGAGDVPVGDVRGGLRQRHRQVPEIGRQLVGLGQPVRLVGELVGQVGVGLTRGEQVDMHDRAVAGEGGVAAAGGHHDPAGGGGGWPPPVQVGWVGQVVEHDQPSARVGLSQVRNTVAAPSGRSGRRRSPRRRPGRSWPRWTPGYWR